MLTEVIVDDQAIMAAPATVGSVTRRIPGSVQYERAVKAVLLQGNESVWLLTSPAQWRGKEFESATKEDAKL